MIVQCEKGYVLVPSYTEAIAYDNSGQEIKHWKVNPDPLGTHIRNFLSSVAANDPKQLYADIQEGHLSSSLCHLGGISHQLGKTARAGEIADQIKANELLSIAFDRMASHLRANDVDVDRGEGAITLGPWLELDPATEQFTGNDAATALRAAPISANPTPCPIWIATPSPRQVSRRATRGIAPIPIRCHRALSYNWFMAFDLRFPTVSRACRRLMISDRISSTSIRPKGANLPMCTSAGTAPRPNFG